MVCKPRLEIINVTSAPSGIEDQADSGMGVLTPSESMLETWTTALESYCLMATMTEMIRWSTRLSVELLLAASRAL